MRSLAMVARLRREEGRCRLHLRLRTPRRLTMWMRLCWRPAFLMTPKETKKTNQDERGSGYAASRQRMTLRIWRCGVPTGRRWRVADLECVATIGMIIFLMTKGVIGLMARVSFVTPLPTYRSVAAGLMSQPTMRGPLIPLGRGVVLPSGVVPRAPLGMGVIPSA